MADLSAYTCTPQQIYDLMIEDILPAGLVPFIKSSPGMGKSSIIRALAKAFRLKIIDVRLSQATPEDLQGLPRFRDILDEAGKVIRTVAEFVPFDTFPITTDALPLDDDGNEMNGWLLFFDEFNSANEAVQAATYKIILDKMVGQHPLHPACFIVCAGNLETDKAIVNDIGTALQSRVITLVMHVEAENFIKNVALKQNWDSRIIAFLAYKNEALHDFRPDHQEHTFCCPRTWEFMHKLVTSYDEDGKPVPKEVTTAKMPLYAGTITSSWAVDFVTFTEVYANLPQVSRIVSDPKNTPLPMDPATAYATIIHLIEKMTDQTFDPIATYVDRFDRIEFKVLFYRGLLIKHPELRRHKTFISSMIKLDRYLHADELDAIAA